ncbi:MAG: sulfotransferase [Pirellulales bacterium]|nr:sulfotransferase [Pirellulales bacterium]
MPLSAAQQMWLVSHGFFTAVLRDRHEHGDAAGLDEAVLPLALALKNRGQFAAAHEILEPMAAGAGPLADDAFFALLEIELLTGAAADIEQRLVRAPRRHESDRGRLFAARARQASDPTSALTEFRKIADAEGVSPALRRLAAFDAVGLLDAAGAYRDAMDLAVRFHVGGGGSSDLQPMLQHLDQQVSTVNQGLRPRRLPVDLPPTAFVVGLPRSGTTLLEQMLDNHPRIVAIGEFDGIHEIIHTMTSQRVSPYQFAQLPSDSQSQLRNLYIDGARLFMGKDDSWTVDKSLMTWFSLPFLAELLPAARYLHIQRDPRDVAASVLLSWLDVTRHPWTSRLRDIYEVFFRAHTLLPRRLDDFGLDHVALKYEELVSDPKVHLETSLRLLGLPFEDATLFPERNTRAVNTLSFDQVHQPLYTRSVGRWKNYEWMFDRDWHLLAESAGY